MGGPSSYKGADVENTEAFVLMCGTAAEKHSTTLSHAMLHAVAVWVASHGAS